MRRWRGNCSAWSIHSSVCDVYTVPRQLDEVTSVLDLELAAEVLDMPRDLARTSEVTMLCVTHAMTFARDVSDRVLMFEEGRVIESVPAELFESPLRERSKRLLRSVLEEG